MANYVPLHLHYTKEFAYCCLPVRHGSRLIVRSPVGSVLIEDQLKIKNTTRTVDITSDGFKTFSLHRDSGFSLDIVLDDLRLIPSYKDVSSPIDNENKAFVSTPGFGQVRNRYCRYPAPNHYTLSHTLHKKRQTDMRSAVCSADNSCPDGVYPGEMYYYRTLNDPCHTAASPAVCDKSNPNQCILEKKEGKLFCTTYTQALADVFGVRRSEFSDRPQMSYRTASCAVAHNACKLCKTNCSACAESNGRKSCSCCFRECLARCQAYYEEDCVETSGACAVGDTSEFKLVANRPANLRTKFNCYLEQEIPGRLYTVRYRVRHNSTRYQSDWVTENSAYLEMDPSKHGTTGTNTFRGLKITHSIPFNPRFVFLSGQRMKTNEPYVYRVAAMSSGSRFSTGKVAPVQRIQPVSPFSVTTFGWGQDTNCWKLSNWEHMFRETYDSLLSASVHTKRRDSSGAFGYTVYHSAQPPSLTVDASDLRSILRSVVANGTIRNDDTFQSNLSRSNRTWMIHVSGYFTSCPGYLGVRVIDETDSVKLLHQELLVLCPRRHFHFDIEVPRKGTEDKERLFSVFMTDPHEEFRFQLAMVNKRKQDAEQERGKDSRDPRKSPWITLMPMFVTSGILLTALLSLMAYAQATKPKPVEYHVRLKSGWQIVKRKIKADNTPPVWSRTRHRNKLKRRHLLLVVFVVVARIAYSVVCSFSMAIAVLAIVNSPGVQVLRDYNQFVQDKVIESHQCAEAMENFRTRESKRIFDQFKGIQKSCDYFVNMQFDWLSYNMSCILQENQVNIFDKVSERFSQRITNKLEGMKQKVNERTHAFCRRAESDILRNFGEIRNYGERVYRNGWFSLPREAYDSFHRKRKRRAEAATPPSMGNLRRKTQRKLSRGKHRRSTVLDEYFGFLDFVGIIDKDELKEIKESLSEDLEFLSNGLLEFGNILRVEELFRYPASSLVMCPLKYMKDHVVEKVKHRLVELAEEAEEIARTHARCFYSNESTFSQANEGREFRYFSERIIFQKNANNSINASLPGEPLNSNESDDPLDFQTEEHARKEQGRFKHTMLEHERKWASLARLYEKDTFVTTKQLIWSLIVAVDMLLLIYRSTRTYQIALKLVEGFTDVTLHDSKEFSSQKDEPKPVTSLLRQAIDLLAQSFAKFISCCKSLQKRILRTNALPLMIVGAATCSLLYLAIAVVFNVMNVTVIEELGGFRLASAKLDANLEFTKLTISDELNFVTRHQLPSYKGAIEHTWSKFEGTIMDFNNEQKELFREVNRDLCRLHDNPSTCQIIKPKLLNFQPQPCVFPEIETMAFDGYDGQAYRQQLKREAKRYVDAVREVILTSIYVMIAGAVFVIVATLLSVVAFMFMKTRGMLRTKTVHLYSHLPQEALQQFSREEEDKEFT